MAQFLEAAMLTAFSVSWYCSIWKMLRTRRACGKSLSFVMLICFGYVCGIGAKLMLYRETGVWTDLIFLYGWNLAVTACDACLVVHFTRLAQGQQALTRPPSLGNAPARSAATPVPACPVGNRSTIGRRSFVRMARVEEAKGANQ